MAAQAEREAAARGGLAVAQSHRQGAEVFALQRTAESDLVIASLAAAHLDRAVVAQRRIERVAHCRRIGAVVQPGGGVGLAAMHQAEREAASARGLELHVLHLGLACAAVFFVQVVEGADLADHGGAANVLSRQAANKFNLVAMALAFVAGVQRDLNVAGHHSAAVGGEHLHVRGFELGNGFARVCGVVGVLPGGRRHRLVHHVELEALEAKGVGEGDAVALVDRAAQALGHRADLGRRSRAGVQVAADRQALQLVDTGHRGLGLADAAVGHKEHVVLAAHRRGGEDQAVRLVHAGLARGLHLDLGAGRRGRLAHSHQANLLDLVDTGLGRLGLGDGDGGGRGGGNDGDTADRLACQRAHELDAVAFVTAARHAHVGGAAHHAQAAQGRAHGSQDLSVGHESAYVGVLDARAIAKAQAARKACGHGEFELGVGLGVKGLLGRQADALVDVDQEALHLGGQAVYAYDFGAGGVGLQAREVAARVIGVGDEGQTKVHLAELQTNGIVLARAHAGKSVYLARAYGDEVGLLDHRAVRQHHLLAALLDCKVALDAEETKQVHVQTCGGLDDLALAAGHAQRQGAAGAGGNVQGGLAAQAGVVGIDPAVVHHLVADFASLVDEHADAGGRGSEALNAHKRQAAGCGLEAGPVAAGVLAVRQQGQAEFGVAQLQANGVGLT